MRVNTHAISLNTFSFSLELCWVGYSFSEELGAMSGLQQKEIKTGKVCRSENVSLIFYSYCACACTYIHVCVCKFVCFLTNSFSRPSTISVSLSVCLPASLSLSLTPSSPLSLLDIDTVIKLFFLCVLFNMVKDAVFLAYLVIARRSC